MTDHMTYENEHQVVQHRPVEILKDRSWYNVWGNRWPSFSVVKVYSEASME